MRRFGKIGMELFDLREFDRDEVLQAVLDKGTTKYQLTYDDRALHFSVPSSKPRKRKTITKFLRLKAGSL